MGALGGLLQGLLAGRQLKQHMQRAALDQQAMEQEMAQRSQEMSVRDIQNRMMLQQNSRPVDDMGTVQENRTIDPSSDVTAPSNQSQSGASGGAAQGQTPASDLSAPEGLTRLVQSSGMPIPDLSAINKVVGNSPPVPVSYLRRADKSRTVPYGGAQYELMTPQEQAERQGTMQQAAQIREKLGMENANQYVLQAFGVPIPQDTAQILGFPAGAKALRNELPALMEKASQIRKAGLMEVPAGGAVIDTGAMGQAGAPGAPARGAAAAPGGGQTGGAAVFRNPPLEPENIRTARAWYAQKLGKQPDQLSADELKDGVREWNLATTVPSGDFEKSFLPKYLQKIGKTEQDATEDDLVAAHQAYAHSTKDPAVQQLAMEMTRARLDQLRQQSGVDAPPPIAAGTPKFRVAQDLAYGKLTFQQFRGLYSYSRNMNDKMAIYDKAAELNPNFNPAGFEMGYTLAKSPKVQQQLASLDNVIQAIPDLLKASDQAKRSGVTALNKLIVPGGIAIGGKQYSNFATAQTAFADELSGALGYGSATDMSREMGFNMTNKALSPDNFRSSVQDIVQPFINRKRSTLLNQMGPYGQPGMNPAATAGSGQLPQGGGKVIDAGTAKLFYDAAGSDPAKGREMATQNGWKVQ